MKGDTVMNRRRTWFAIAALATGLAVAPMSALAQEAVPGATDPLIIVGWEDNDGGPIMGHASDIEAMQRARAQTQLVAEVASNPDFYAADMNGCAQ
jgi:hypothetical protein